MGIVVCLTGLTPVGINLPSTIKEFEMGCPECHSSETYVEDEYYGNFWHILTMSCHECCALYTEDSKFDQVRVLTKGNV